MDCFKQKHLDCFLLFILFCGAAICSIFKVNFFLIQKISHLLTSFSTIQIQIYRFTKTKPTNVIWCHMLLINALCIHKQLITNFTVLTHPLIMQIIDTPPELHSHGSEFIHPLDTGHKFNNLSLGLCKSIITRPETLLFFLFPLPLPLHPNYTNLNLE